MPSAKYPAICFGPSLLTNQFTYLINKYLANKIRTKLYVPSKSFYDDVILKGMGQIVQYPTATEHNNMHQVNFFWDSL